MITLTFGETTFNVYPEDRLCETVFFDGTTVLAEPEDSASYRAFARDLGYGDDTWRLCVEHQMFHHLLAAADGRVVSPTLWAVAHGTVDQHLPLISKEETAVIQLQKQLNKCFV